MKKEARRKLSLNTQTIRTLTEGELAGVGGGGARVYSSEPGMCGCSTYNTQGCAGPDLFKNGGHSCPQ